MEVETVIQDQASLRSFFVELGEESCSAIYRGFRFETEYRVPPRPRPGLITMEPETRGLYVTVHLGVRVDANADLRSRWGVEPGLDDLDSWYDVHATDEARLRRYVSGDLERALVELAHGFGVLMRDELVQFGPLLGTPAETARALDLLVEALPAPAFAAVPFEPAPCALRGDGEPTVVIGYTTTARRAHELKDALLARGIPCVVDTLMDMAPPDYRDQPRWHLLVPDACEAAAAQVLRTIAPPVPDP